MPADTNDKALRDISEALKFEHWVRFYFVVERDDKLYVEIPARYIEYIGEKLEAYQELVNMLNNREINYQSSCEIVCSFLASTFDGRTYPEGTVSQVLDSKDLRAELHLFSLWIKAYEEKLDSETYDFEEWIRMYEEWRSTEEVKRYAEGLSTAGLDCAPDSDTIH